MTRKQISAARGRRYVVFTPAGLEVGIPCDLLRDAMRLAYECGGEVWLNGRQVARA